MPRHAGRRWRPATGSSEELEQQALTVNPESENQPVARAVKLRSGPEDPPKGYRHTVALVDDASGERLAHCDVCGQLLHAAQVIETGAGERWGLRPNRRIMPSHWTLSNPSDQAVLVLDQRIFGKLSNPLTRVGMSIKDPQGAELYRVVEPEASLPERLLGPDPDAWSVEDDHRPVALIATLPKTDQFVSGWRGKLQRFIQGTDTGLVSLGQAHHFGIAESLAILMIFRELRDITKSAE